MNCLFQLRDKVVRRMRIRCCLKFVLFLVCLVLHTPRALIAAEELTFNEHVRPILANNCFHCHGPDEEDRQADLRLDVPGEVDFDLVLERITSNDPDYVMPPPGSHKKLSSEQIETLEQWIAAGAAYQTHWAFAPLASPEPPAVSNRQWSDQPIDQFVLAKLEAKGKQPSPPADQRTLIRRLSFDLTGLPPTPEEIQGFLEDRAEGAYERLVDRLLAKPQYGEHLTRYWLDLVRFADTNGLHHDHYREMTLYRDWVIRSFNENKPFDEFIVEQVAGDLLDQPSDDQLIASGFNRLHLIIDVGTALPEESFARNVIDRVSAVGTAFLGLTLQCAVCHDHKYDPVTQREFYQLYAFFNNFDGDPETGKRGTMDFKRGLQEPYLERPSAEQTAELERLTAESAEQEAKLQQLKSSEQIESNNKEETDPAPLVAQIEAATKRLDALQKQREQLLLSIPAALVMKERAEVRPTHLLVRGQYDQPGELVTRGTPSFLPPLDTAGTPDRLDLARWLVDPSHPLTARVAVNRYWQQLFGVGLVRTSEDFGSQGEVPSHPALLDFLATQFVDSGWDVKSLLKSIVLSQTYRQSSQAARELFVADPQNRLLARGSRYRLDAEMIRDQVLAVTGLLNDEMYGKSVKPPQPEGLWELVAMPSSNPRVFKADQGDKIYRRSVYTFWKRGLPPPQLTIFDAPSRESCIARRERTNTPLQSLVLMNEQQFFAAAMHLAESLLGNSGLDETQRITTAYERITSQLPPAEVLEQLRDTRREFADYYLKHPEVAAAMLDGHAPKDTAAEDCAEFASWTMLVHSLLNLDETKTRE